MADLLAALGIAGVTLGWYTLLALLALWREEVGHDDPPSPRPRKGVGR